MNREMIKWYALTPHRVVPYPDLKITKVETGEDITKDSSHIFFEGLNSNAQLRYRGEDQRMVIEISRYSGESIDLELFGTIQVFA